MSHQMRIVELGRMLGVATLLTLTASLAAKDTSGETGDLSQRYGSIAPLTLVPQEGLQRLSLPLPVLQASRSSTGNSMWADVRVLDAAGRPVPIAWLPSVPAASVETDANLTSAPLPRFAWPSAVNVNSRVGVETNDLRVQINSAGAVVNIESSRPAQAGTSSTAAIPKVWLLDLSALPYSNHAGRSIAQLQLDWPASEQGLSSRVEVEGSMDAQRWSPITAGPLLELPAMNAAAASDAASTRPKQTAPSVKHVDWPAGLPMPRYLRLSFDQPLALSQAQLRWSPTAPPVQLSTTTVQFQPVAANGTEPAHWALDLQGPVPVQQLQLNLPQINTVLGLRLEQRNEERQPWRSVATFVAWRLLRDGKEQQSSPVEWPTSATTTLSHSATPAARHWRLVPDARTPQLSAEPLSATIGWQAPQLVLVAQGGTPLRLAVGRERDTTAAVAWQTLVPGADGAALKRLPQASVGKLTPQMLVEPNLNQRIQSATPEDQRRWLLWGVLGLAVVGLGALAWSLGRDMKFNQRER